MGGFGTYAAVADRPGLFAAAVPISSGGGTALAATYAMTPLWAFHGASDNTVSVASDRSTITAIQNAGGTLERYTELPGQDHSIWGPIYNGNTYTYDTNYTGAYIPDGSDNVYSWMFAQRAVPEPQAGLMLVAGASMLFIRRRRTAHLPGRSFR
jgi:predicted peptidase